MALERSCCLASCTQSSRGWGVTWPQEGQRWHRGLCWAERRLGTLEAQPEVTFCCLGSSTVLEVEGGAAFWG